jgi:DNA primase
MLIGKKFIEELRERVSIEDIISKKVDLKRHGKNLMGLCPFHQEKTPSFHVIDDDHYHCFGCGAHGDVITFVMRTNNMSFYEAIEELARQVGMEIPKSDPKYVEKEKVRTNLYMIMEEACRFFEKKLKANEGERALKYLKSRGLNDDIISKFRLGFAPDNMNALYEYLRDKNVSGDDMKKAGLIKEKDGRIISYFFNRVIFPIADKHGRVIAFGGRVLDSSMPKYLNSPDSELFHKGSTLYNLSRARESGFKYKEIIAVEGYMDVISLANHEIDNVVAPLGTAITERQIEVLWRMSDAPVLCFDGDSAGVKAAHRAAERVISILRAGKSLRFAFLPNGLDPDDYIKAHGKDGFLNYVKGAKDLSAVVWEMLILDREVKTPEQKAAFDKRINDFVHQISDKTLSFHYRDFLRKKAWEKFGRNFDRRNTERMKAGNPENSDFKMLIANVIKFPAVASDYLEDLSVEKSGTKMWDNLMKEIVFRITNGEEDLEEALLEDGYDKELKLLKNEFESIKGRGISAAEYFERHRKEQGILKLEEDIRKLKLEMNKNPTSEVWQRITKLEAELKEVLEKLD